MEKKEIHQSLLPLSKGEEQAIEKSRLLQKCNCGGYIKVRHWYVGELLIFLHDGDCQSGEKVSSVDMKIMFIAAERGFISSFDGPLGENFDDIVVEYDLRKQGLNLVA